jgi:hypothetical protein
MGRNSPREINPYEKLIESYTKSRGHSKNDFIEHVLNFVNSSFIYHDTRTMIKSIETYLVSCGEKIDTTSIKGRRIFYRRLARFAHSDDPETSKGYEDNWSTGTWDIDRKKIEACFNLTTIERPPPAPSRMRWRYSIARTLTYIRVLPPHPSHEALLKISDSNPVKNCWHLIRQHPHHLENQKINQHCMDEIYYKYCNNIDVAVKHESLGKIKSLIEARDLRIEGWHETWSLFKAITFGFLKIPSNTKHIWSNESEQLWDDN